MEIRCLTRSEFAALMPQIMCLHQRSFGSAFAEGYLEWRYLNNPEKNTFACVAMDGDTLVSFFGAIPLSLAYRGNSYRASMSLNAMTDPQYGRQGLFRRVAEGLLEQLVQDHRMAVIGFSNVHSNHIHCVQLEYKTVYEIPMLELPLDDIRGGACLAFDDTFSLRYPLLDAAQERLTVQKTPQYLRWRYTESPENDYRNIIVPDNDGTVRAFSVCKQWRDKLNLVEFHVERMEYAAELLDRCITYAKERHCHSVTVWAPLNTELHYFLEKKKFINHYPIHYFNAKPLCGFEKTVDCLDHRNWALQMGDNNTY